MSGLIWAGIGKGIADAGQTFGAYMAKDIEANRQDEREALREERLLARQAALDQLKADREEAKVEALKQRVATESGAVGVKAAEIGTAREGRAFDRLAESSAMAGEQGDVALSKEQLQKLAKDDPELGEQYKKLGLIESSMPLTVNQKRLQRAEDEAQAATDIGAHSSVIDAYSKKRDSVLAQIREENRVEGDRRRDERSAADRAASDRRFEALMPIRQQQADASTTRAGAAVTNANTPRGGGSDRTEQDITAAENALSNARAKAEKSYPEPMLQEKYDPVAKAEYEKKKKEAVDNDPDVKRQRERVERMYSGGGAPAAPATPKSGDNRTSTRPPLSSFAR
jgi:hypothetical protein